jgi:hypothetical protein
VASKSIRVPSIGSGRATDAWRLAAAGLVVATIVVGIAIVVGAPLSRVLNGVGALVWVGSGILLALSLPASRRAALGWAVALLSGFLLGAVVRPGTPVEALIGFGLAGFAVVFAARDRVGAWALLVPTIYLPVHLIIGIGRALMRDGGVRTDPPPTAAIVPLVIVLAAGAGGALAAAIVRRGR